METKDIFLILSPFIASYLTYFLWFRTKRKEEIIKFKEERYLQLLWEVKNALVIDRASSSEDQDHHMNIFLNEQRKLWLYWSDDVIKSLTNLLDLFTNNPTRAIPKEFEKLLWNLVLSIRKDLWINSYLKSTDFKLLHNTKQ